MTGGALRRLINGEPVGACSAAGGRVLVAGVGDLLLGDDGWGVEVVRRLAGERGAGERVDVVDFGVRGGDLACALQRDYDLAIIVDVAVRGRPAGTITVLEVDQPRPDLPGSDLPDAIGVGPVGARGVDPVRVLRLAAGLGRVPDRVVVVCCEPSAEPPVESSVPVGGSGEGARAGLSGPVRAAIGPAVRVVMDLIAEGSGRG